MKMITQIKVAITQIVGAGLVIVLALCLTNMSFAEANKESKSSRATKEVQGEVTWIGKDKIAVTYGKDEATGTEYEILLPFNTADLSIAHKKNLGEINVGDTVKVQYEEESLEYGDGRKEGKLKAKIISFLRPATPKPKAQTPDEEEKLPLKGVK